MNTVGALPSNAGIVDGLRKAVDSCSTKDAFPRGLLLLAEMSSSGNLISNTYVGATVAMAEAHPDFVFGFIAQKRLRTGSDGPDPFVYMTPGVKLDEGGDALGQVRSPSCVCVISHYLGSDRRAGLSVWGCYLRTFHHHRVVMCRCECLYVALCFAFCFALFEAAL